MVSTPAGERGLDVMEVLHVSALSVLHILMLTRSGY